MRAALSHIKDSQGPILATYKTVKARFWLRTDAPEEGDGDDDGLEDVPGRRISKRLQLREKNQRDNVVQHLRRVARVQSETINLLKLLHRWFRITFKDHFLWQFSRFDHFDSNWNPC